MADDEFDIDIYGDTAEPDYKKDEEGDVQIDSPAVPENSEVNGHGNDGANDAKDEPDDDYVDIKTEAEPKQPEEVAQKIKSTDDSGPSGPSIPKQAPQQQGVKRKEGSDDRPIDPGATTALTISELHWWNTDDDIRGWVNQAECEDELKEITFSEHKVNGKSKGQAYVEFTTQQAATAAKHKIESFGEGQQYVKKHVVTYSNPNNNPFKTLPKDVPARADKSGPGNRSSGPYNSNQSNGGSSNFSGNNFRGRTPGYNSGRGGMNNVGGGGFNRNFSSPGMGGMNGGGFQGGMTGFPNGNMGNNFNRGGMMNGMRGGFNNMRGGRGGMGNGMMNMPGMGMNGMGGMPNGMMNMPMMGAMGNMQGAGFPTNGMPGMPHFNPAFFQQNQAAGGAGGADQWQNPHGAKRQRPE